MKAAKTTDRMLLDEQRTLQKDARQGLQAFMTPEGPSEPVLFAGCAKLLETTKKEEPKELNDGTKLQIKAVIQCASQICEENRKQSRLPDKVSTLLAMALEVRTRQEDYQDYQTRPQEYQIKWGKYSGQSLAEVLQDTEYIKWLLRNKQRCTTWEAKVLLHHVDSQFVLSGKELKSRTTLESAMQDWTQAAQAESAMEARMMEKIQAQISELMKRERPDATGS
eukprot:2209141-Amphidinium_carterae.1